MTENPDHRTLTHVEQPSTGRELSSYDIAKQAMALASTVDEAKAILDDTERMEFYARQANDRELIADAMALVMRARRRLGEMLVRAKEAGQLSKGGRPRNTPSDREGVIDRVTLAEAGVTYKLSMEAQKLAGYDEDDFEQVIERGREKIKSGGAVVINPVKDLNTKEKQLHRDIREAQLAARQKALPEKKYGVILADPEWSFDVWSEAGLDRSPDNHYPTSSLEMIGARPVETIAAEDCVLFLWVTAPHHAAGNGAAVMRAWGFVPKAEIIWDKVEVGNGFWFRNRHEVLIVGVRGNVPAPAPGTQWPSIVTSPKGAHSDKPDWAYELIEDYFPNLPKIELNARRARDGWDAWGFEAPDQDDESRSTLAASSADDLGASPAGVEGDADRHLNSVATEPEESAAIATAAEGEGEGGDVDPAALPEPLTVEQQNDIIRAGYGREPKASIAELMAATGLKKSTVKMRAITLGLASQENQRTAARRFVEGINARRRQEAVE